MFRRSSNPEVITVIEGLSHIAYGLVAVLSLGFIVLNRFTPYDVSWWYTNRKIKQMKSDTLKKESQS